MSDNTALIQDLFGSIAQEGWSTKFNDALADDLVWVATGSSPVAGTIETRGKSGASMLARSPRQISLLDIYRASAAPQAFAIHSDAFAPVGLAHYDSNWMSE